MKTRSRTPKRGGGTHTKKEETPVTEPRSSSRARKPIVMYGTEEKLSELVEKKKTKKKRATRVSRSVWAEYEKRGDGFITKALNAKFLIDTYDAQDQRESTFKKVRPEGEIKAAHQRVASAKAGLRDLLKEMDGLNADVRWGTPNDDDASVDVEEVGCSKCGGFFSDDSNDIILCDRKNCYRAFHIQCCDPPLDEEQLGDPDDDWFCHQCNCMERIVDKINEAFDKEYHDPDRWTTVFESDDDEDDSKESNIVVAAAADTILGTNLDSDDDESDFVDDNDDHDDDDDDESKVSDASGDDPFALERDSMPKNKVVVEDVNERNIINEPRKRAKVNYVKLNDALNAEQPESSDDDDDDDESSSDDASWSS